ncbi:MAG: YraN family protein [Candidatus Margulisiibacteriota bacterium]
MRSYLLGVSGEQTAEQYLRVKGYSIIARNFRSHQGEIDLIARSGDYLVFVEVKNYSFNNYRSPASAISKSKKESLIHAARYYLFVNRIKDLNCRFDVLTITRHQGGGPIIDHLENAFEVSGC